MLLPLTARRSRRCFAFLVLKLQKAAELKNSKQGHNIFYTFDTYSNCNACNSADGWLQGCNINIVDLQQNPDYSHESLSESVRCINNIFQERPTPLV